MFDPWVGKIPGGENGNPLQYSCLKNPMGRGAWQATVHGLTKSQTLLSDFHFRETWCATGREVAKRQKQLSDCTSTTTTLYWILG